MGDDEKLLKHLAMPLSEEERAMYYGMYPGRSKEAVDAALESVKQVKWHALPRGVDVWWAPRPSKWLPLLWYTLGCASTVVASIAVRFVFGG